MKYCDGCRDCGQWRDGKQHGFGVLKYRDGRRYDGQWRDGKRQATIASERSARAA